jgi:hypothetical protein
MGRKIKLYNVAFLKDIIQFLLSIGEYYDFFNNTTNAFFRRI